MTCEGCIHKEVCYRRIDSIQKTFANKCGDYLSDRVIEDIKVEIKAIQKEDLECDGCSDMGMVLDIIDKHIGKRGMI